MRAFLDPVIFVCSTQIYNNIYNAGPEMAVAGDAAHVVVLVVGEPETRAKTGRSRARGGAKIFRVIQAII